MNAGVPYNNNVKTLAWLKDFGDWLNGKNFEVQKFFGEGGGALQFLTNTSARIFA